MRTLCFPHTPTFSDQAIAFHPDKGVFIIAEERAAKPAPTTKPADQPIVRWQPAGGERWLRRLAVALGIERRP